MFTNFKVLTLFSAEISSGLRTNFHKGRVKKKSGYFPEWIWIIDIRRHFVFRILIRFLKLQFHNFHLHGCEGSRIARIAEILSFGK